MSPDVHISVTVHKSLVKLRWRTRFRLWRFRRQTRKMSPIINELSRRLDEAMLYGEEKR